MPFEDGAVDMVYTSLALEQMDLIIDDVLSEIQRVSMKWALLYEAFSSLIAASLSGLTSTLKSILLCRSRTLKKGLA